MKNRKGLSSLLEELLLEYQLHHKTILAQFQRLYFELNTLQQSGIYSTVDVHCSRADNVSMDGFHSIFHHRNWRAKRSCDAILKQHRDVMPSSCHSEKMLWNSHVECCMICVLCVRLI